MCPWWGHGAHAGRLSGGWSEQGGRAPGVSGCRTRPCAAMISQAPAPRFGRSAGLLRPACLKHLRAAQRLSQPLARPALAWTDEATADEAPTCPEPRYPTGSLPGRCALREPTSRSPPSAQTSRADPSHSVGSAAALTSRPDLPLCCPTSRRLASAPHRNRTPPHKHTIGLLSRDRIM